MPCFRMEMQADKIAPAKPLRLAGRIPAEGIISLWCPVAPRLAREWQPAAISAWVPGLHGSEAVVALAAAVIAAAASVSWL